MQKKTNLFHRILSAVLVVLMVLTSVPLSDIAGFDISSLFADKAQAAGVAGYSPLAAVEWAKQHWNDTTSVLLGKGYWARGTGDCANFVSQCIYMGGIDMNSSWHTNGYNAHFSETNSKGSFIRAQQLYDYVCSIGGQSIKNPSASQVEIGDLIFYWKPGGSRINHSAIVIDIVDGVPQIAYHSDSDKNNKPIKVITTDWHCARSGNQTYLVKMNGAPCISPNPRDFDVYTVSGSKVYLYKSASTSSTKISTYKKGEYTHIFEEKTVNGVKWGYTQRFGVWGWVKISSLNYQTSVTSGITSHLFGEWYTTKEATCAGNGEQRRDCVRCDHYETRPITGGHSTGKPATCYEGSYCDICGTLISSALGHKWNSGEITVQPTCVSEGVKKYTCQNDNSHTYTETLPADSNKHTGKKSVKNVKNATCVDAGYTGDTYCADCGTFLASGTSVSALGHTYVTQITTPTCTQNGLVTKKCSRCNATRTEYANGNNTWSDWTTEVVSGIPSNKIQTKTQYRYKDKSTTSSYATSLSGWTQSGSTWVNSGSGSVDYCSFPSGFSSSHSLYSQYNNSPVSASETATTKTEVSTSTVGYIFWHWCRGGNALNINRKVDDYSHGDYTTFHAFYSTSALGSYNSSARVFDLGSGNSYGGCKDTYWWIGVAQGSSERLTVNRCNYTTYNKLFYYYKWSDWSAWQDGAVYSSDTRIVETRTLYKYDLAALGHDFSVDGGYKAPTCTQPGYSGKVCSRCGTISSDTTIISALGHVLYESPTYDKTKEQLTAAGESAPLGYWYRTSADGVVPRTYRRDCARGCGYYETKSEGCIYVLKNEVAPTCLVDGKKVFECTLHGETKEEPIAATGHNWGEWITLITPMCETVGKARRICKNDSSHIEDKDIAPTGHTLTKVEKVNPKCEVVGNTEYYKCDDCGKIFSDESAENEITVDDTVIPALGHSGLDKDGNEVWEIVTEPKCGETGYKRLLCQREFDGKKCEHLIDESEIPGLEPIYKEIDRRESTCEEPGFIEYTCTRCEGTKDEHGYSEDIEMKEHTWSDNITEKANCTDYGRVYRECTYCGEEEFIEELLPLGHDKGTEYTVYATCTEDGYSAWECKREGCGYKEITKEYSATGHNYSKEVKQSNCTEGGYTVYTCTNTDRNTSTVCGYTYSDAPTGSLGHDLGEWYTVTAATCLKDGLERSDCSRCAYYETRVTKATGHNTKTTEQKPTCTEDGYTLSECQNKGCNYSEKTVIEATGHKYKEGTKQPATCNEVESVYMICENDSNHNYLKLLGTEPLGHDFSEKIIDEAHLVKAATCTESAVYVYDCARTGSEADNGEKCETVSRITFIYGEPLNHDWGEWETVKEPDYDNAGERKSICKNDSSHVKYADIPVLTRPSDRNDNVNVDKTVDYDSLTGEATIKLNASSLGEKITSKSRTPLDIVLVLDQSGSMANGGLSEKLQNAVEKFTGAVYEDAKNYGLDHRVSMVGFAMQNRYDYSEDYYQYLNTEVLTTGKEPVRYNSLPTDEMNEVYKNSLVSIGTDGINPVITTAIANIEAKGATAADLGLDMACKVFSQNPINSDRKRIVVFMTDGVPTYKSDYMSETAQNAEAKAVILKETYGADLYAVGVLSGETAAQGKKFLNSIASVDSDGNLLYFDCTDAEALVENFEKIAEETTVIKTAFDDITLVDTVSSAFTLTAKQEQELITSAVLNLGVKAEDIRISRFSDGTTEVRIQHITPKKVTTGDNVKFVIEFSFSVTANENALTSDSYLTNTDNAGVIVGTKDVYENNFASPSAYVDEAEGVIYFNINGKTYHILRVNAGEIPEQPEITIEGEYTFSGWDIPEEISFEGGKLTLDSTLEMHEYSVVWITEDSTYTDYYHYGDIIEVPVVQNTADGRVFTEWDKSVPVTMPAEDMTFTAVYAEHEHTYSENIKLKATCTTDGVSEFVCECGEKYEQPTKATGHKWATRTTVSDGNNTAFSNVYCENCGSSPDKNLSYTVKGIKSNREVTYDLKLVDAEQIKIDVDGNITISMPIPYELSRAKNIKVYREEEDGTLTELNGTKNGSYITFTTDHFSKYILKAVYECDETGEHKDSNCDERCDYCTIRYDGHTLGEYYTVISPSCTERGAERADCVNCTYFALKYISPTGHSYENGICTECGKTDGIENTCVHICHKSGFANFIWKIILFFCKIFGVGKECSCGMAHY